MVRIVQHFIAMANMSGGCTDTDSSTTTAIGPRGAVILAMVGVGGSQLHVQQQCVQVGEGL